MRERRRGEGIRREGISRGGSDFMGLDFYVCDLEKFVILEFFYFY